MTGTFTTMSPKNVCSFKTIHKNYNSYIITTSCVDLFINLSCYGHYSFWTCVCTLCPVCVNILTLYALNSGYKRDHFRIILTISNNRIKYRILLITDHFGSKLPRTFVLIHFLIFMQSYKVTPVLTENILFVYRGNYPQSTRVWHSFLLRLQVMKKLSSYVHSDLQSISRTTNLTWFFSGTLSAGFPV